MGKQNTEKCRLDPHPSQQHFCLETQQSTWAKQKKSRSRGGEKEKLDSTTTHEERVLFIYTTQRPAPSLFLYTTTNP